LVPHFMLAEEHAASGVACGGIGAAAIGPRSMGQIKQRKQPENWY